jgi:gamma-glutamyl hercynylcysteine S-oxide synthase
MTAAVAAELLADLRDCRARTLELVAGLDAGQLIGPKLDIVNPLLWEIGHLAWFHEHFILRRLAGRPTLHPDADALYDSAKVAHATRWDLPLPSLAGTKTYMRRVHDALAERLGARAPSAEETYLYRMTTRHEDMHGEAFAYSRQTLGYPAPVFQLAKGPPPIDVDAGPLPGDAEVPGGKFRLGSPKDAPFVFDNEKWAHAVHVKPFRIARAPVTNAEYAAFVDAGGYKKKPYWSAEGWSWRLGAKADHPVYWLRQGGQWAAREFDATWPLQPHRPVMHVNWHEAEAYCRWAGRRLPSEAEWEFAAVGPAKRPYPWGAAKPSPSHANLEGRIIGCADVGAFPAGDSRWGCRQMMGNIWEWTASDFRRYPGFAPDAYAEYSAPWFGSRKVLRGGAWATRARVVNAMYRNFFTPDRRDIFAGFRTCALD